MAEVSVIKSCFVSRLEVVGGDQTWL